MKQDRLTVTSIIAALLLAVLLPVLVPASGVIDYGAEAGLAARSNYNALKNILYNFRQSVDKKYYAGAYFEEEANQNPQLYILVTDISAVPEIDNARAHFVFVKYSEVELIKYRDMIEKEYLKNYIMAEFYLYRL